MTTTGTDLAMLVQVGGDPSARDAKGTPPERENGKRFHTPVAGVTVTSRAAHRFGSGFTVGIGRVALARRIDARGEVNGPAAVGCATEIDLPRGNLGDPVGTVGAGGHRYEYEASITGPG